MSKGFSSRELDLVDQRPDVQVGGVGARLPGVGAGGHPRVGVPARAERRARGHASRASTASEAQLAQAAGHATRQSIPAALMRAPGSSGRR